MDGKSITWQGWRDRDDGRRLGRYKPGTDECKAWLKGWAVRDKILKRAAGWRIGQEIPCGLREENA